MTPKERAAMQQALEAMIAGNDEWPRLDVTEAITALREALAERKVLTMTQEEMVDAIRSAKIEQAEQEPVAWCSVKGGFNTCGEGKPLYAAPVRTKDLTDDEIAQACGWKFGQPMYEWVIGLARAVIAKLREKERLK